MHPVTISNVLHLFEFFEDADKYVSAAVDGVVASVDITCTMQILSGSQQDVRR